MKATLVVIVAVLSGAVHQGGAHPTLELHYPGERQLAEQQQAALRSATLRLLATSNFNSVRHRGILGTTPQHVHAAYRKTVSGRYLVLSFQVPERIKTVGGDIDVLEVVVGLNRPDYADSLFTIDAKGRVVHHGKYSGALCLELVKEVLKALPDA